MGSYIAIEILIKRVKSNEVIADVFDNLWMYTFRSSSLDLNMSKCSRL